MSKNWFAVIYSSFSKGWSKYMPETPVLDYKAKERLDCYKEITMVHRYSSAKASCQSHTVSIGGKTIKAKMWDILDKPYAADPMTAPMIFDTIKGKMRIFNFCVGDIKSSVIFVQVVCRPAFSGSRLSGRPMTRASLPPIPRWSASTIPCSIPSL